MSYQLNKNELKAKINGGFDITYREIKVKEEYCFLCFLNSLSNADALIELIKGIYQSDDFDSQLAVYSGSCSKVETINDSLIALLSGQCVLLYQDDIFLLEVRNYPNTPSNEASNEQSIRGSHDGFVENIILNVGLIRRRIRDPRLKVKIEQKGIASKTDVAYLYMEGLVEEQVLNDFEQRLSKVNITEVIYERSLSDALFGKSYNPYPNVRFCERPDVCGIHLLQGYIIVLVDNSFTAMILPTTFFEMTKQIEEYTQETTIGLFIRLIRLLAIFLSLYLLPVWLLAQLTKNPTLLQIPIMEEISQAEMIFQVVLIELLVEWIRLSFIHTPQAISGVLGFLFIFLLGESAVGLNLYSEDILVLVVLCNVCNYVTPNYELSLANKCFRILLSLITLCFGLSGFSVGLLFHFFVLMHTKSIYMSYLYPLIPFDIKEIQRLLIGAPIKIKRGLKK